VRAFSSFLRLAREARLAERKSLRADYHLVISCRHTCARRLARKHLECREISLEAKSLMIPGRSSMEIGSEHGGSAGRSGRPGQMTRSFPPGTMTFFLLTRGQSQVRSSPSPFSSPSSVSLFLVFLRTIRHRSLSCVAVVEQEETDWHSVRRRGTYRRGVPSSSSFPTGSAIARKRPRFRVSFFSSEPIFNLRAAAAPTIAGPE